VAFVKTYLSLMENDYYLKDLMVEDPVAGVRFPKFAAGATLEWQGQTYYFVGEETRHEFEKQKGIGSR
jgi:YHS domain-containing protein